jgi:hypothetical protein
MKLLPLFAGLLLIVAGVAAAQERPDPRQTPGEINPDEISTRLSVDRDIRGRSGPRPLTRTASSESSSTPFAALTPRNTSWIT